MESGILSFARGISPIVPGNRASSLASRWAKPAEMSRLGSIVGTAAEAEPPGEPAAPGDEPGDVPADVEGVAVRAGAGVAVAVALPQAATRVATMAAPRSVRIVALERRTIRLPRSHEMPRPLTIAAA